MEKKISIKIDPKSEIKYLNFLISLDTKKEFHKSDFE